MKVVDARDRFAGEAYDHVALLDASVERGALRLHVHGIAAMVERGEDCESIVRQALAVQAALRAIKRLIVKHHLAVCLREHWQTAEAAGREQGLAEVVALYSLMAYR